MSLIRFSPDVLAAFSVNGSALPTVAHLRSLKIGTVSFTTDYKLKTPHDDASENVVGVIEQIEWPGDDYDPFTIQCRIFSENRQPAMTVSQKDLNSAKVTFGFAVYERDNKADRYFRAFHTGDTPLNGYVRKISKENERPRFDYAVGTEREPYPSYPETWTLRFSVTPAAEKQTVHFATAHLATWAKSWGVPAS
jgi:hypothetical protein